MADTFAVSPFHLQVPRGGDKQRPLYRVEIQDIARGFCGALFLALPLHYTMEMWTRARAIPAGMMVVILIVAYFLNVGFCYYSNYKSKESRQIPWLDALTSFGIGAVASTITLLLADQLTYQMSPDIIISCIALEMVPTSFGASLASSQLGMGNSQKKKDLTEGWSRDKTKMIASLLGACMFAFNVAATREPIVVATSSKPLQLVFVVVFSVFVSYLMVFMTGYEERDDDPGGIMGPKWAETVVCYAISLLVSAALLVMFGYLTYDTPLSLAVPWVAVLGYATSLGGSAGRLVI